jgi:two-component system, NtrC family, nitrogen regulation sensor histidine kinase NtrY
MKPVINRRFRFKLALLLISSIILIASGLYLFLNTESFSIMGGLLVLMGIFFSVASIRYIESCFNQIDDFFNSLTSGDASRRYLSNLDLGTSLASHWNDVFQQMDSQRQVNEESLLFYRALIERVPVPLIIRHGKGIRLENISAKHLFNLSHVVRIDDFNQFGAAFVEDLKQIQAGERITSLIKKDQSWIQVSLSATKIYVNHDESMIISVNPIQQELDKQEIESWQNLVRVFTHEIMNSMTPIVSLSQTANDLLNGASLNQDDLDDVKSAVNRVGKRAEHLMKFVQAYRKISEPPLLQKSSLTIEDLFNNIHKLMKSQLDDQKIEFSVSLVPGYLSGYLDPVYMEQALINLLQNAIEAVTPKMNPKIVLRAYLDNNSHLVIEVEDNGVGIKPEITDQLFTPFFTSKPDGSGIGLFLVKQIVLAHDGKITAINKPDSGAILRMVF